MLQHAFFALLMIAAATPSADVVVSRCTIVVQPGAHPTEMHAASELRDYLSKITGFNVPLVGGATKAPENSIVVGPCALAKALLPDAPWKTLGSEQTLVRSAPTP